MKICLVNNLYPPYVHGGTESAVQQTAALLIEAGHQVVLITTTPDRSSSSWSTEYQGQLTIHRFRPRNIYYYTDGNKQSVFKKLLWHNWDVANAHSANILRQLIVQEHPDIVHGHNLKGISYTLSGICHQLGIPYIHTIHNYQLLTPYGTFGLDEKPPYFRPRILSFLYQRWNRRMFAYVSHVISPTVKPLQLHQQAGFFTTTPSTILPSPVTIPDAIVPHSFKRPLRLVYFGSLEEVKGIRQLITAVMSLPSKDWILDVFGTGTLLPELQAQTTTWPNISWRGWSTETSLLQGYDALVYPSRCYETQGLSMIEAMAQGTPVIAAAIGSIPESIEHGKNGLLYDAAEPDALLQLLDKVIGQPALLSQLRDNARNTAARFSPATYIKALVSIYTKFSNS